MLLEVLSIPTLGRSVVDGLGFRDEGRWSVILGLEVHQGQAVERQTPGSLLVVYPLMVRLRVGMLHRGAVLARTLEVSDLEASGAFVKKKRAGRGTAFRRRYVASRLSIMAIIQNRGGVAEADIARDRRSKKERGVTR